MKNLWFSVEGRRDMNLDGAKEWDFEVLKCVFKVNFWEFWVGSEYDDFNLSEFLNFFRQYGL